MSKKKPCQVGPRSNKRPILHLMRDVIMSIEIEVITTKKKLSMAIVKQLRKSNKFDMDIFNSSDRVGYHINNVSTSRSKQLMLFQGINDEWVIADLLNWKMSTHNTDTIMVGSVCRTFNKQSAAEWIEAYNTTKERCLKNHLIL